MIPYYTDDTVTLYHGANLPVLQQLPDESVDCVVTSPPYFGLRDYGVGGQYGAEASPAEFVGNLVATVKAAGKQEQDTLVKVTEARAKGDAAGVAAAERTLATLRAKREVQP